MSGKEDAILICEAASMLYTYLRLLICSTQQAADYVTDIPIAKQRSRHEPTRQIIVDGRLDTFKVALLFLFLVLCF